MKSPIIQVTVPETYLSERRYIVHTLLCEFLGLSAIIKPCPTSYTTIEVIGHPARLTISEGLFKTPESAWLHPDSLPSTPLRKIRVSSWLPDAQAQLCEETLPIIYGDAGSSCPLVEISDRRIHMHLDIFGSCFWMLTRYEEYVVRERDAHQRFPANMSLAYREGFLSRPLVNEYLEILWIVMKRLWRFLRRKSRTYRVIPTHDVDWPAVGYRVPWRLVLRGVLGDVFARRSLGSGVRRLSAKLFNQFNIDPANTFDWLMNLSETYGLQSEFYFISDHTAGFRDGVYTLEDEYIRNLLRMINKRGHLIGLHPSYETYCCPEQVRHEFDQLYTAVQKLGIQQSRWGGRQHYLRWENPITWQAWDDAGLDYDSTLTYADHVGFRCSVCYEYPVFNLKTRQSLRLRERPLIAMDRTLLDYMKLSLDDTVGTLVTLGNRVRRFAGEMVLLWHNSCLLVRQQKELYEQAIRALVDGKV